MKNIDWSVCSIIGIFAVLLLFACICEAGPTQTEGPLKCHVCDADTCKNFDKNAEPKECTVNELNPDNTGPTKLYNLSHIGFRDIDMKVPLFVCQKIEVYLLNGGQHIMRRCQLRLPGNESCTIFHKNLNTDRMTNTDGRPYMNATCVLCDDKHGCNSSGLIYVWIPLLLSSIVLRFFIN